jgi:hypothetical protein
MHTLVTLTLLVLVLWYLETIILCRINHIRCLFAMRGMSLYLSLSLFLHLHDSGIGLFVFHCKDLKILRV